MGDHAPLSEFKPDDGFLRRVAGQRKISDGVVHADAFLHRQGEHALSYTHRGGVLATDAGLDEYQRDKSLPSGDLPGICMLEFRDLTERVKPPLPPRWAPDVHDERYGDLHCETDLPKDDSHREQLASLATRNGILRNFVRKTKTAHP